MRTQSQLLMNLGLALLAGLFSFALARGRTPEVVGKVLSSSRASVEGSALLFYDTIFSGDLVSVGEGGTVLFSFSPKGLAALAAATTVRFSGANGNIVAQILSGSLEVKKGNEGAFVVNTSKYRVEPQGGGRTDFLVALLPDKTTIVEAQRGKVAITRTSSGESYTLREGLRAEIPASATEFPGQAGEQSKVIGKVVASVGAAQNGNPLPSSGTVFDGDLVTTGATGRAVIQLSPTTQVSLNQNTSARFTSVVERVWVQLQNGTIVAENTGENYVLVATTRFRIQPTSAANSRIFVQAMTDNSTYIESGAGDVSIEEIQSGQSYLLPAGESTLVPANSSGVPGLQRLPATPAPATPRSQPQPPSALKPPSHKTILILGIAAAGGVAGAAAGLSRGGGGGGQPVSPSAP